MVGPHLMDLFDLALILAGWLLMLASPSTRSIRTVGALTILSALMLASNRLASGQAEVVKIAVVWCYVLILLRFQQWFLAMPRPDLDFDEAYRAITDRMVKVGRSSGPAFYASESFRKSRMQAIEDLAHLRPPNSDWDALRERTVDYLRFSLRIVDSANPSDAEAWAAAATQWRAIQEEWGQIRRRRSRFWP